METPIQEVWGGMGFGITSLLPGHADTTGSWTTLLAATCRGEPALTVSWILPPSNLPLFLILVR